MSRDLINRVVRSKKRSREQCVICLENLFDQEIGIPDCCQHVFCFTCLVKWSKEGNSTCPNDRGVYQFIFKKHSITSRKPFAKVDINNTDLEISLEEEEEERVNILSCYICDNEDHDYHPLLTCNGCRKNYHEFCLNSFNTSKWICPSCECNNEERSEPMNNLSMVKSTQTPLGNIGLRDHDRTGRSTKPLRRLQQTTLQHVNRRMGSLITSRNTPSSSTTVSPRENHANTASIRSVITHKEAARRIAASGLSVLPNPRSAALISRAQYMTALRRKRKLVARLPRKIPINQLPRIQRRSDAPVRPRSKRITQKPKSLANASFLDKLLYSQNQLYSLENIQMKGAHIKLS